MIEVGPALLEDFAKEALYAPEAWFVHRVVSIDPEASTVIAELDTTRIGALVDAQIELPCHPKHVPAIVAIQMTGSLSHLFAVYGMNLRTTEGWAGFGTQIKQARFPRMGTIGPPVIGKAVCTRKRLLRGTWFFNFDFELRQEGEVMYSSSQMAAWTQVAPAE